VSKRPFTKIERDSLAILAMFETTWLCRGEIAQHFLRTPDADLDAALTAHIADELIEQRGAFFNITRHGLRLIDAAGGASNVLIHGGNGLEHKKRKAA
jgi:hypothetical protein